MEATPEPDDNALLREYVEHDSQEAFAALVTRHIDKVYSVALRYTRNPHPAEEITQAVFVILAQRARRLSKRVILSGWLCQTARLTAMTFIRGEIRRARREQEAHLQRLTDETETDAWPQIAPLLDAAMAGLNKTDHHAVVLRFFDGKSMKEIAAALGASEDAAKARVSRAVEKLRSFLKKRGVVVSAAVLTGAISTKSVQAAPAVLARTATAVAFAKGATASTSTLVLTKGALKLMTCSKTNTAIAAGMVLLLTTGTFAVKHYEARYGEAWRHHPDLSLVDVAAPQTKILPALQTREPDGSWWGARNDKLAGLGVASVSIVQAAYDVSAGRMILAAPMPGGRYDFISTQPNGQQEALQQAVKNEFGLVGRHESIETNVLVLTLRNTNAPGLAPNSNPAIQNYNRSPYSIECTYASMSKLGEFLENVLKIPVVDQTGLAGHYDINLKWDSTPDGLKQAMLSQLGLEMAPGRETVDYLIVEEAH